MCFMTSEIKGSSSPKLMSRLLRPRMNNFNNQTRQDIIDYYSQNKKKPTNKYHEEASPSETLNPYPKK